MNLDQAFENLQIENIQLKNQLKEIESELEKCHKKQRLDKKIIKALIEEKSKLQEFLTNFQKQNEGFKNLFKKILDKNPKLHKALQSAGLNLQTIQIDKLTQNQQQQLASCSNCIYLKTEKKIFEDRVNKELDMLQSQVQRMMEERQQQDFNNEFYTVNHEYKENDQSNVDQVYRKSVVDLQQARSKSKELKNRKNQNLSFVEENQKLDELIKKYSNV